MESERAHEALSYFGLHSGGSVIYGFIIALYQIAKKLDLLIEKAKKND